MSCVAEPSELHSALPMKCLSVPGEKLHVVLMCVVLLMVPILRYTEHVRNFVRSSVWTSVDFYSTLYRSVCIMFCFIAI
jgi:hypothetical protein